jgi:TRAP-type C4-dicarboxylate transport system permease small subunit
MARFARLVESGLGVVAAALLFAMMLLTFVDVVGRYLFNQSVVGAFEITEIMMALLIFAGLPLVVRREEHVTVDLADRFFPRRVRRAYRVAVELASGALMLGLAHLMWRKAGRAADYGDTTTVLLIKYAPFIYAIVAFLVMAGIIHFYNSFARQPPRE